MRETIISSAKEKIFSGIFWKFSERILTQMMSFIVSVILSRILMPEDYGAVAMVNIFISIADIFITSGFSTSLIQKKDATSVDFSTIFYCSFIASILLYGLLFATAPLIAQFYGMPALTNIIRIFSLRLLLSAYNSVQHAYISRKMIFKRFFFSTLFGTLLSGIVGITMAYQGFGVWALIAQYFVNSIVDTAVLAITVKWYPRLQFSWKSALKLMSYGWKVLATDLSGNIFNKLRPLLIGKWYSLVDLAYYDKGTNISSLLSSNIFTSVTSVMFPAFSNENDNIERVKNMFRKSIQILSFLIFPLLGGCIAVAHQFILVIFTEKWAECIFFVRVLCLIPCIELTGHLSIQGLKATNNAGTLLRNEVISKPFYVICLIFGCIISLKALALSMVIASAMGSFINTHSFAKIIKYKCAELASDLKASFAMTLIMAGTISLLNLIHAPNHILLLIQIPCGIVIYVMLSIITKNDSFIYLIKQVKGKLET